MEIVNVTIEIMLYQSTYNYSLELSFINSNIITNSYGYH